jgi:hypothetical protein
MAALVDTFPFPFYLPEAQELHATPADIYPTSTGALYAAARAGLNPAMLFGGQPAFYLWRDILQESSTAGLTRTLVQIVGDQNPNNPRRTFLDALDDNGKLVALHHAGGRPQEVAGKLPLRKNEGIRIPRIVAGLAQLKVAVP